MTTNDIFNLPTQANSRLIRASDTGFFYTLEAGQSGSQAVLVATQATVSEEADLLLISPEPAPRTSVFLTASQRWAKFRGSINADFDGVSVSGFAESYYNGIYIWDQIVEGRPTFIGDALRLYYNAGRFEFRTGDDPDASDLIAYSQATGFTHAWAPELTWYDAATDDPLALSITRRASAGIRNWHIEVEDVPDANDTDTMYVRRGREWAVMPPPGQVDTYNAGGIGGNFAADFANGPKQFGEMYANTTFNPPTGTAQLGDTFSMTFTTNDAYTLDFSGISIPGGAEALLPVDLVSNKAYRIELYYAGWMWALRDILGPTEVD